MYVKIYLTLVCLILTYLFTYSYYHFYRSIFFACFTTILFGIWNRSVAIIFLALYLIFLCLIQWIRHQYLGNPLITKYAYNGQNQPHVFLPSTIAEEFNQGKCTYSFGLYIQGDEKSLQYRMNEWKSVFYRGTKIVNKNQLATSFIQFPGVWLTPHTHHLVITFQNQSLIENIEIENIPLRQWIYYSIVIYKRSVLIYMNGILVHSIYLQQPVISMNPYSIYVANDAIISTKNQSGFAGFIGELNYYPYVLTPNAIYQSYVYYKEILNQINK